MSISDSDPTAGLNKHLLGLYRHELWYLASSIVERCRKVFDQTPPAETDHYIKVAPEVHAEIFGILSHAAGLKKLIRTPTAQLKDESKRVYRLRRHRTDVLASLLGGLELKEILQARVRNSIEHFDEYLDSAIVQISDSSSSKHPWAAYNMVLSDRAVFDPEPFHIRVYIASERKFHNMKWSINIGRLHDEAEQILIRLHSAGIVEEGQDPGGMLVILGTG